MNATKKPQPTKPFPWLLVAIGLLVLSAVAAAGWNWYQKRYPSWYEEVRLSDGRVITIHQKREYHDNYGTAQSWVTIDLPELGGKQTWHSYLMPMRVDIKDGVVYVFGRPRGPLQVGMYKYPKYLLVAFRWSGSGFERTPFLSIPEELRREENIYSCLPNESTDMLRMSEKDQQWCNSTGDRKQFGKSIDILEYQKLAAGYARLDGGTYQSE